jgi:hypothetical protein
MVIDARLTLLLKGQSKTASQRCGGYAGLCRQAELWWRLDALLSPHLLVLGLQSLLLGKKPISVFVYFKCVGTMITGDSVYFSV